MISHLGAAVSLVAGMLVARRMQGKLDGVVGATCVGDGATSTGAFHEGLNMAAVEKLPLVVLVADNQFAYSTPRDRQFACDNLVKRAAGYGVSGHEVDGTNLEACLRTIQSAVRAAREGGGPQLVVGRLLRLCGHGEHDDGSYVPPDLKDSELGRDCLEIGISQVVARGLAGEEEIMQWQMETAKEVQNAVAISQKEEGPDPYKEDWQAVSERGMS